MGSQSTNLGLYLPTGNDYVNVKRDISDNFQKLDDAVAKKVFVGRFPNTASKLVVNTTEGSKFIIFGIGTNQWCQIIVNVTDANLPRPNIMQQAGSSIACTGETGKLNITTTSSNACVLYALVFEGSISIPE